MPRLPSTGFRADQMMSANLPDLPPLALDNLLSQYLSQEGIDRRYSHLILRELHDATDLTEDQLNQAANELITDDTPSRTTSIRSPPTPDFNNSNV